MMIPRAVRTCLVPYEIREAELQGLFAHAGSVESVNVMRDQATGRTRGFAFVEMSTDGEAQSAITALNGTQVGGRNLTVNEARPKAAHSGGFGGGPASSTGTALVVVREGTSFNDLSVGDTVRFDLLEDDVSGPRAVQVVRPPRR